MTHKKSHGFTLIELLTVMAVIAILAGLILSISGYAQKKAASSKAENQIAALSSALENYKADNGIYPRGPGTALVTNSTTIPANATDILYANTGSGLTPNDDSSFVISSTGQVTPTVYTNASLYLYVALSGDADADGKMDNGETKGYFEFKPDMLSGKKDTNGNITAVYCLVDPFGYSYGYSTAYQADVATNQANNSTATPTHGYNPSFDLWSTAGGKAPKSGQTEDQYRATWIKNW
jgi:prepilin-type N-terminal cleavage/methylation domain-containing protein